ncbi:hypothetical protein AK812_SmicGene3812 [Symbiodinium microadriaticum]|uniref:Uncharacterized protein n=1 Tax=Symbiodinium microadriaticum TaxID=2951 RepID=A0A1Q9EY37_SYMMI|nr:hypothetical protein AK812_SmicGene3812 [Symbiodinium microadriaticum]CAE7900156.1 unnamed protein product [Symbiodinium microadriaticum]
MASADDELLRVACLDCINAWCTGTPSPSMLEGCSVLHVELDGSYKSSPGAEYTLPAGSSAAEAVIEMVRVLQTGSKSSASVHARIGSKASLWLVFLKDVQWKCISVAAAPPGEMTLPKDFEGISACVWDGYCKANRACDGNTMAEYFHETCRLTFVDGTGAVMIIDSAQFCNMVQTRYTTPMHKDYAHLRDDPRVGSRDALLSIDFGSLSAPIAMVVLTVAHPPCLWTDLLTVAKLQGKWWIVHKSSVKDPFLEEEKK